MTASKQIVLIGDVKNDLNLTVVIVVQLCQCVESIESFKSVNCVA